MGTGLISILEENLLIRDELPITGTISFLINFPGVGVQLGAALAAREGVLPIGPSDSNPHPGATHHPAGVGLQISDYSLFASISGQHDIFFHFILPPASILPA